MRGTRDTPARPRVRRSNASTSSANSGQPRPTNSSASVDLAHAARGAMIATTPSGESTAAGVQGLVAAHQCDAREYPAEQRLLPVQPHAYGCAIQALLWGVEAKAGTVAVAEQDIAADPTLDRQGAAVAELPRPLGWATWAAPSVPELSGRDASQRERGKPVPASGPHPREREGGVQVETVGDVARAQHGPVNSTTAKILPDSSGLIIACLVLRCGSSAKALSAWGSTVPASLGMAQRDSFPRRAPPAAVVGAAPREPLIENGGGHDLDRVGPGGQVPQEDALLEPRDAANIYHPPGPDPDHDLLERVSLGIAQLELQRATLDAE